MTFRLICFSLGIIFAGYLPCFPPSIFLYSAAFVLVITFLLFRKKLSSSYWLLALLVGVFYGILSGYNLLAEQLPVSLAEQDLVVEGRVVGLPQENYRRQLFSLNVTKAYPSYDPQHVFKVFPRNINISSYGDLRVKTGERWRLIVKLKPPRGFVNPNGFDYQAFLLRHHIGATGYIRKGDSTLLQVQPAFALDVLRYELQQWLIRKSHSDQKGILVALLVGDTSLVDKDQWGEMIKTGTNHLIAISGLHLGFFAIIGFFVGNFMGRFIQLIWHKYPSMISGYVFSVGFAVFYSIIAGSNIPTIRTLIMLSVVQLSLLWQRTFRGRDTLLLALVLVLLYDPLAAFDIGFWLSFGAVFMLVLCFSGRRSLNGHMAAKKAYFNHLRVFVKSQWVMLIGLLIPLSLLVHTSSLLSPPANFVAIPVITFFVVPCLIFASFCHFVFAGAEDFFLHCAELGLSLVHQWLQFLLGVGAGHFNPLVNINPWAIYLAVLSVLIILLPRGVSNKYMGVLGLALALIIPLKKLPDLQLLFFDVGQGTAVLIRTPQHQLLYDTGPQYTENFDAGSGIIVPYLQSQGIRKLDSVVVSHNDKDHSGGLDGLLAATQVSQLWLGEPEKYRQDAHSPPVSNCHEQPAWEWDSVKFRFITWSPIGSVKPNNHSCVLLVEYQGRKVLLTGDIEKEVERSLLAEGSLDAMDVLLAPHHGSNTSSTDAFVARVQPKYVIYSAGFHNQHGHPHPKVQARYLAVNSLALNTANNGALEFVWQKGVMSTRQYRQGSARYWFNGTGNSQPPE